MIARCWAAFARMAWCTVGTAVYQVGRNSTSEAKNVGGEKPELHTQLVPAISDVSIAAIGPYIWKNGNGFRHRSFAANPRRHAQIVRRSTDVVMRQWDDFRPRCGAGRVQHERHIIGRCKPMTAQDMHAIAYEGEATSVGFGYTR